MPFGPYKDFDACVRANQDKGSPQGYCASIHKKVTGEWPGEVKKMDPELLKAWDEEYIQNAKGPMADWHYRKDPSGKIVFEPKKKDQFETYALEPGTIQKAIQFVAKGNQSYGLCTRCRTYHKAGSKIYNDHKEHLAQGHDQSTFPRGQNRNWALRKPS